MKNFKSVFLCKWWPAFSSARLNVAEDMYLWLYIYISRNILYNDLETFQHNSSVGTCSNPAEESFILIFVCLSACWSPSCLLGLRFLKGSRESSYQPLRTDPEVNLLSFWKTLSSGRSCSGKGGVWVRCYGDAHCGMHTQKRSKTSNIFICLMAPAFYVQNCSFNV